MSRSCSSTASRAATFDWEEQVMPALAASHRVIAFDLLGMGLSERPEEIAYGFDAWSRQVVDVMDALGLARATLVAHSLGAAPVAIVAGEHPERVERLVLVAPLVPLEQDERQWFFKLLEIPGIGEMMLGTTDHLPQLPGFSDAYHARAHAAFLRHGTRDALLRHLRHGRDLPRLVAAYRTLEAPTLIVAGMVDDTVPYPAIRRWAPAIHDAVVLPLEDTGHWVMREPAAPAREHDRRLRRRAAERAQRTAPRRAAGQHLHEDLHELVRVDRLGDVRREPRSENARPCPPAA
jgi:pimeloyl-ACP methyl ester carboxylesterase